MKSVRLKFVGREHKRGTGIDVEFKSEDIDLANSTPVTVWVLHRTRKNGKVRRATLTEFNPGAAKTWNQLKTASPIQLTPSMPGFYTVILVAMINKRPVTYRGEPLHVT